MRSARILLPLLLLLVASPQAPGAGADAVSVRATPVPLNADDPDARVVGRLEYRGGLHLTSEDPRFGGISSIRVLPDGQRLVAVTDEGSWLSARLVHEHGRLVDVKDVEMGPLLGPDGREPAGKDSHDAESLAVMPDGSLVVGFEREHRLLRYPAGTGRPDGVPVVVPSPPQHAKAPFNGGVEALVVLRGGALFALTEYWLEGAHVVGWTGGPDRWKRLGYRFEGALRPSDGAALPRGDLLVVERAYNPDRGIVNVRVREIPHSSIRPGASLRGRLVAEFAPPFTLDNYEGIAVREGEGGETRVLLASDDNLNREHQRTLLLEFALRRLTRR